MGLFKGIFTWCCDSYAASAEPHWVVTMGCKPETACDKAPAPSCTASTGKRGLSVAASQTPATHQAL